MQLRKTWILATAVAVAVPALAAPPRPRAVSPFELAPRAVSSTSATPAAELTANPGTPVRMRVGGMVAIFEASEPAASFRGTSRPGGLQAIMDTDEVATSLLPAARGNYVTFLEEDRMGPQVPAPPTPLATATSQTHTENPEGGE